MARPEAAFRRAANEISKVRGVSVYGALQWPGSTSSGATMVFGSSARWDSDGYYSAGQPTRITVPNNLEGRYLAQANLMWSRGASQPFTIVQRDGNGQGYPCGYFTAVLVANNIVPSPRENLSVAPVAANAMRTTQSVYWETDLVAGDYLELALTQHVIGVDPSIPPNADTLTAEANIIVRRLGVSA